MNRRNFLKRLGLALIVVPAIKLGVKSKEAKADGNGTDGIYTVELTAGETNHDKLG